MSAEAPASVADVLTPTEAAARLKGRKSAALRWLRERGLIRVSPPLGPRVVWGDVVDAIRAEDLVEPGGDAPAPRRTVARRLPSAGVWPPRR